MITNDKYKNWLNEVRLQLLSLNVLGYKNGRACRTFLFKQDLILDEKSWFDYFESGYTPRKAINEDLELPWIEYKPHTILS